MTAPSRPTVPHPDLCVFIGRFQPLHAGHILVIREGLRRARFMVVLVGSANEPRTPRNPFTAAERAAMIKETFGNDPRLVVLPLEDSEYNLNDWLERAQQTVDAAWSQILSHYPDAPKTPSVALIGHAKDATSYYLNLFPRWSSIDVPQQHVLCATTLRQALFGRREEAFALLERRDACISAGERFPLQRYIDEFIAQARPAAEAFLRTQRTASTPDLSLPVLDFLEGFVASPDYATVCAEVAFVFRNKYLWRHAPYAPIAQTGDAVVVQSGHVLMIRRASYPGKGLWALPGGDVEEFEEILDGTLRELEEEVGLKVPHKVLLGHLKGSKRFSAPHRSARGRVITEAFHFEFEPGPLPKVRSLPEGGNKEVMEIAWKPLANLRRDECFEDHYPIIKNITATSLRT